MRPTDSWPETPACVEEQAGVPETSCMTPSPHNCSTEIQKIVTIALHQHDKQSKQKQIGLF
jgi:hypothetical protein